MGQRNVNAPADGCRKSRVAVIEAEEARARIYFAGEDVSEWMDRVYPPKESFTRRRTPEDRRRALPGYFFARTINLTLSFELSMAVCITTLPAPADEMIRRRAS